MGPRVSGCYYHPEKGAVATCTKCGVGICKECAVKDDQGVIICYRCANEYLKQKHKEHRKSIKEAGGRFRNGKEFIIPGIIGAVVAVVFGVFTYKNGDLNIIIDSDPWWYSTMIIFIIEYLLFSIPFGYIALVDLFAPKYRFLNISDIIFIFMVKFLLSLFIGWVFLTFYLIRFILGKSKNNKA